MLLLLAVIKLDEKESFCSAHHAVGQERLCSCALRLNPRIWSLQECVAVQLSASQPPTRPGMTLSFAQMRKTSRGFEFPALESNAAVFRSLDTCVFLSDCFLPSWGFTLTCDAAVWFTSRTCCLVNLAKLCSVNHKWIACISVSSRKDVEETGLLYCCAGWLSHWGGPEAKITSGWKISEKKNIVMEIS